ncbi:hypothetical protein EYC80_003293 [Monilinia laxa]|uniref:Uncharacterized protein n=1 Tax=Monilinia laxa TaxID=61186 RepID=A0A5N6KDH8_MONLA|nr:hypothetical protein EYC80_003293 [Monilinia laxa]
MPAAAATYAPPETKLTEPAALLVAEAAASPVPEAEGERVVEPLRVPLVEVPLVKVPVAIGLTAVVGVALLEGAVVAAATAAKATRKMEGCILHVRI